MAEIYQGFKDRVRYSFQNSLMGTYYLSKAPFGWKDDGKEFDRNKDYHGIIAKFSNSLSFKGDDADYITIVKETQGVQGKIRLTKEIRNARSDNWEIEYSGYLDMSTWSDDDKKGVSVKFNSGGLLELIKARDGDEVELERETSLIGTTIPQMTNKIIKEPGRKIFLASRLKNQTGDINYAFVSIYSNGNTRNKSCAIPMKIVDRSHEELSNVMNDAIGYAGGGTPNMMFFYKSETNRNLKLKGRIDFTTNISGFDDVNYGHARLTFTVYKDQEQCIVKTMTHILYTEIEDEDIRQTMGGEAFTNPFTGQNDYPPIRHSKELDYDVELLTGESMAIEWHLEANMGSDSSRGHFHGSVVDIDLKLSITEDSYWPETVSKMYMPYEVIERLLLIYTGKSNILKSNILGRTDLGYQEDGEASLIGMTHGFWVRGFDKLNPSSDDEPNLYKPLSTSLRDFMDSYIAVSNIGLGIERVGYKEKIVIEDLKYFYRKDVTIKLPLPVKNVKKSITTDYIYSAVEIGYDKGGSYEEAQGLDEFNAKTKYATPITVVPNTFTRISKYRADMYGHEFCRRKPYDRYPSLDTAYDTDIFLRDAKKINNNLYKPRVWQDDFAQSPTGIYSPDTAGNLRLSPFNLLLKHGWEIMAGLTRNITEKINYISSTGNSGMKTKLIGGVEYSENGSIVCNELERARYQSEIIEFDHIVDSDLLQKIEGYTLVGNEKIYNVYGLIEYQYENGDTGRGWLLNLKPNKEGKWKLLKLNS